jgi:hypothetical protein
MVALSIFTVVLGLSLIFSTFLFLIALPPLPSNVLGYPTIGLFIVGYGFGLLTDEVRDVRLITKLEDLERNPERRRQCYAWMFGFYSKYVLYEDRSTWKREYDEKAIRQAISLGIGNEELFTRIKNFPTLTEDDASKIAGLGLEVRDAVSSFGTGSASQEIPEHIMHNLDETRKLFRIVEAMLEQDPVVYRCFLLPILAFQFSRYPALRLVDMPITVEDIRNPAALSKILLSYEKRLDNPFISKKLLGSLRKLVDEVNNPPGLRPGEAVSDIEIERVANSRAIDSLLESVETALKEAGLKLEAT